MQLTESAIFQIISDLVIDNCAEIAIAACIELGYSYFSRLNPSIVRIGILALLIIFCHESLRNSYILS